MTPIEKCSSSRGVRQLTHDRLRIEHGQQKAEENWGPVPPKTNNNNNEPAPSQLTNHYNNYRTTA